MIGTGSEEKNLRISKKELKVFFHIKNVPHKNIFLYHNISHIYVALNQAGN